MFGKDLLKQGKSGILTFKTKNTYFFVFSRPKMLKNNQQISLGIIKKIRKTSFKY